MGASVLGVGPWAHGRRRPARARLRCLATSQRASEQLARIAALAGAVPLLLGVLVEGAKRALPVSPPLAAGLQLADRLVERDDRSAGTAVDRVRRGAVLAALHHERRLDVVGDVADFIPALLPVVLLAGEVVALAQV